MGAPAAPARLADVVAALSSVSDLARGHPTDEAQRACLVALALARDRGIDGPALQDVYYTTLLRAVGCTATSHELAALVGGDDVGVRRRGDMIDGADPRQGIGLLLEMGGPGLVLRAGPRVAKVAAEGARADCEVGARVAQRLGLPPAVSRAIDDGVERWDGRGSPKGAAGEAIGLPARLALVASACVMFEQVGGPRAAPRTLHRGTGSAADSLRTPLSGRVAVPVP
jgi:hypothetical protein